MTTAAIVILVVLALLALLAAAGTVAAGRRNRSREAGLRAEVAKANEKLADARADDRGWDRDTMEEAARAAAGGPVEMVHLVHVEDHPGTDDDVAVYRVVAGGAERDITLRRSGDTWSAA